MVKLVSQPKGKLSIYIVISLIIGMVVVPAYAAEQVKTTSGGTIDVGFQTDPSPPQPGSQAHLDIAFYKKHTTSIQPHIDYRVSIKEGGNQVFGIPITHTAEGKVSVPFTFQDAGTYAVTIEVDGILFQPIPPETVEYTVIAGSGSSSSGSSSSSSSGTTSQGNTTQGTTAQSSGSSSATQNIVIPSWIKNNAKWWSEGQLGDNDFVKGLQYMIQNGIMQVPHGQSGSGGSQSIPSWIKKNAGWWASGELSDGEFVKGIQYLITNGIIVLQS